MQRLKRVGLCKEDALDSLVIGLWLGKRMVVEEQLISPSPHGDTYELWAGPPGSLHQVGGDWGWTDSDVPPTYGCDRMVAAGGGVVAITYVPNNLGDATACTGRATSTVILRGAVNTSLTLPGTWGAIATNGKRVVLRGFDATVHRTDKLAIVSTDGQRLGVPHFAPQDIRTSSRGWLTPRGLFLDARRGLVGPRGLMVGKGYTSITIGEGRIVYVQGRSLRARRLTGGPDRLITRLPGVDAEVAAGSFGVAVMTGTVGVRLGVYRIPWRTIDAVLPR